MINITSPQNRLHGLSNDFFGLSGMVFVVLLTPPLEFATAKKEGPIQRRVHWKRKWNGCAQAISLVLLSGRTTRSTSTTLETSAMDYFLQFWFASATWCYASWCTLQKHEPRASSEFRLVSSCHKQDDDLVGKSVQHVFKTFVWSGGWLEQRGKRSMDHGQVWLFGSQRPRWQASCGRRIDCVWFPKESQEGPYALIQVDGGCPTPSQWWRVHFFISPKRARRRRNCKHGFIPPKRARRRGRRKHSFFSPKQTRRRRKRSFISPKWARRRRCKHSSISSRRGIAMHFWRVFGMQLVDWILLQCGAQLFSLHAIRVLLAICIPRRWRWKSELFMPQGAYDKAGVRYGFSPRQRHSVWRDDDLFGPPWTRCCVDGQIPHVLLLCNR